MYSLTNPYAVLLSFSSVISATYANITEKVTEKTPDTEIRAKYHLKRKRETSKCDFSYSIDKEMLVCFFLLK